MDYLKRIDASLSSSPKTLKYLEIKRAELEAHLKGLQRGLRKTWNPIYAEKISDYNYRPVLKFIMDNIDINELSSMLISYFLEIYGVRKLKVMENVSLNKYLIKLGDNLFKNAVKIHKFKHYPDLKYTEFYLLFSILMPLF